MIQCEPAGDLLSQYSTKSIIRSAFGALDTFVIYDIVPSGYFAQLKRFIIGAFISCGGVSTVSLKTSTQTKTGKAIPND